jgi:flagellar biosynthesis/type III secretory pathway M-ring protein FliF/YscJ
VHLVGSSVPNLSSGSVTVADSNGNLLAGPGVAEGEGGDGSQTDSYDQAVQAKVEAYLAAALGQNNADVQVNATLSYDQVSTTTQSITPGANGQPPSFCTQTSNSNQSYTGTAPPGRHGGNDHRRHQATERELHQHHSDPDVRDQPADQDRAAGPGNGREPVRRRSGELEGHPQGPQPGLPADGGGCRRRDRHRPR